MARHLQQAAWSVAVIVAAPLPQEQHVASCQGRFQSLPTARHKDTQLNGSSAAVPAAHGAVRSPTHS